MKKLLKLLIKTLGTRVKGGGIGTCHLQFSVKMVYPSCGMVWNLWLRGNPKPIVPPNDSSWYGTAGEQGKPTALDH